MAAGISPLGEQLQLRLHYLCPTHIYLRVRGVQCAECTEEHCLMQMLALVITDAFFREAAHAIR